MKRTHLHIVRNDENKKTVGLFGWLMDRINQKKIAKLEHQKKFLELYFSRLYMKNDAGTLAIPHFIKAKDTVDDLIARGLITDVYNHIIKRGLAC